MTNDRSLRDASPTGAGRRGGNAIDAFRDDHALSASTVTELDLFPLTQKREQTHARMAHTVEELERLRGQREELERRKQRLEMFERRQVKYEQSRTELRDGMVHRMELLRKMDMEASRRAELFAAVRRRFEEMLGEVERLREQHWAEDRYDEELNRALAVLEDIHREYNRAWSKVEAVSTEAAAPSIPPPPAAPVPPSPAAVSRGFFEWLKVGTALSLPLISILVVLFVAARWIWNR